MKRLLSLIMLLCVLLSLWGCGKQEAPVKFYYPRTQVRYNAGDGVIGTEERDTLSRKDNLPYLLAFYLDGPISSELALPVPPGTRILEVHRIETHLTLVMSWEFAQLEGMALTTACACISATCFDLTDAQNITFSVGTENGVIRTVTRDSMTLSDTVTQGAETAATE